jgi:membrane-anchored protein YejM (alkaline phosphatase superfamily)
MRPLRRTLWSAALFSSLVLSLAACGGEGTAMPGDILLIVVDTARADHFSSYGYSRPTTPSFDRLAKEGMRFEDAWAQSPWTLPAMATILTGRPPHVHGAGRAREGILPIRPEVATLAERMAAADYRTAAFINVIWCGPRLSALDRGFELYDFHTSDESNRGHRDAMRTTDAALAWLDMIDDDPFFIIVHYFDPHLTYDPPPPYDTTFEEDPGMGLPAGFGSAVEVFKIRNGSLRLDPMQKKSLMARYDGELRYTDEQFARLRKGLERRGRWKDALVIVVADHGEEFWDHGGFEHGHSHYRELLRVPLIVKKPGEAGGEVAEERVTQLDIAPTILEFAGLDLPDELPGKVLGTAGSTYAVAEGSLWGGDLISVRSDDGSLILNRDTGSTIFFDAADIMELSGSSAAGNAEPDLLQLLHALPRLPTRDEAPEALTEKQLEELRSLGYLQ